MEVSARDKQLHIWKPSGRWGKRKSHDSSGLFYIGKLQNSDNHLDEAPAWQLGENNRKNSGENFIEYSVLDGEILEKEIGDSYDEEKKETGDNRARSSFNSYGNFKL